MEALKLEKNLAIRAKEDLAAQVRILKKRLQEAEEEQYKAEEDAAALRAEIELLHQREERRTAIPLSSDSHIRSLEDELATIKVELQTALQQVQREQQKLAIQQQHVAELTMEKGELKTALDKAKGEAEAHLLATDRTMVKVHYDQEVQELASMVERLETGRQKLLAEIDEQSIEIERLFAENGNLAACLKEASSLSSRWEHQVQQCLEQNAVLCKELQDLRAKQTHIESPEKADMQVELAEAKRQAETLNAQVLQLSAELNRAMQEVFNLNWLYKPVLANIENRLLQLKQQG